MARLTWQDANTRSYESGLDRGVLYPKISPAVAWNGLTSVEETGAESSTAYYIDGRPFLFLPRLKEYKAVIKAFTYPDEFSEAIGVVEATDGMYLDSQMGTSFDLSYRTLVGDGATGKQLGYKIHLVYNATVAPQGATYTTLNADVNPVDLSWEIQAVPLPIKNYHPTAHIIIDTRHLDANKLKLIEDLLYGTSTTVVSELPRPEVVFDTLNFGDTVTIVDNLDGTWTATGNYLDVILDADGNFTLNNVDVRFLPDGIFYFGPIPPDVTPGPANDLDGGSATDPGPYDIDGGSAAATAFPEYDGGTP